MKLRLVNSRVRILKIIPACAVLFLCVVAQTSLANIYMFKPLELIQTNIYAFANEPRRSEQREKYAISRAVLETILREGIFANDYKEWITLRKNLIDKEINGTYYDLNGRGYKWLLIDTEMLHLESSSGKSGFVTFTNISIKPRLMSYEKATTTVKFNTLKVIGFMKDRPVTGPVIAVKPERLENFLRRGKTLGLDEYKTPPEYKGRITDDSNGNVYERYSYPYDYSYKSSMTINSKGSAKITHMEGGGMAVQGIHVSGSILASDGNIYFWDLRDDEHLFIEDENGTGCILSLEQ